MDFQFTEDQEMFRAEIRNFLHQESATHSAIIGGEWDDSSAAWELGLDFCRKVAAKGWLIMSWPKQYDGQGCSAIDQLIYVEETAYARAPECPGFNHPMVAVGVVGPTLMLYGNDEQRANYLPKIAKGDVIFCLGYSEPNAGSDLAALQTSALASKEGYVINGQKIFTTGAHRGQYLWLAARTNREVPKHKGISLFILDMKTPGITIRPLKNILGSHTFNEVFLDDVRVPQECLVGEENQGWHYIVTALDFERAYFGGGIDIAAKCKRILEELVEYIANQALSSNRDVLAMASTSHKLADLTIEIEVARLLAFRVAWMRDKQLVSNYEASMQKMFASELGRRTVDIGMQVLGLYGQLRPDSKWARLMGRLEVEYLGQISNTIGAGSSEIQRNIIAQRGLGLPR